MVDFFSALQQLGNATKPAPGTLSYQDQSQMNNTFDANPAYAEALYGARNQAIGTQNQTQQVQNQGALLALQTQEDQQKLSQQKAAQQALTQIADPTQRLIAQVDPSGLGRYLAAIKKQGAAADQSKAQAALLANIGGPTPGVLNPPENATAGNASGANPLSIQNNNPGNMKDPSTGQFQAFSSPEDGVAAMTKDLTLKLNGQSPAMIAKYGQGYTPTLTNLISTWAPQSDNNDTQGYINSVAQQTGINPNAPLTVADLGKLQPAMIHQEGGPAAAQYFGGGVQPQPVQRTPLQAPDGASSAQNVNDNGPVPARQQLQPPPQMPQYLQDLKTLATAPGSTEHQQNAFIDAYKEWGANQQKEAAKNSIAADPLANDPNAPPTGQARLDYMKQVDPGTAGLVQDALAGKASVGQLTTRNGQVKPIVSEIMRVDPTFDFTQYAKRQKAAIDFSTGDDSKTIYNLNNAASDLSDLKVLHGNLDNGNIPAMNFVANKAGAMFGNGNPGAYTAKAQTVANELEKISSGKAATLGGSQHAESAFSVNSSPEQATKAIQQAVDGINNRLSTLADKRNKAFGSSNYTGPLLSDATVQKLSDAGYSYDDVKGKIVSKDQAASSGSSTKTSKILKFDAQGNMIQ